MKYAIEFDNNHLLYKRSFNGKINMSDIVEAWGMLIDDKDFVESDCPLVSDYRNAELLMNVDAINQALRFYDSKKEVLKGRKHAVLVEKPRQTALALLFKRSHDESQGMLFNLFEEEQEALRWINEKG